MIAIRLLLRLQRIYCTLDLVSRSRRVCWALVPSNGTVDQTFFENATASWTADNPQEAVTRDMFLRMMTNNQLVP